MDTNKKIINIFSIIFAFIIAYVLSFIIYKIGIIDVQIPFSYDECIHRYYVSEKIFNYWDDLLFGGFFILLLSITINRTEIGFYFFGKKLCLPINGIIEYRNIIGRSVNFIIVLLSASVYVIIGGIIFHLISILTQLVFEGFSFVRKLFYYEEFSIHDYCNLYFYQWVISLNIMFYLAIKLRVYLINKFIRRTKYYLYESLALFILLVFTLYTNTKIKYDDLQSTYDIALSEFNNGNYNQAKKCIDIIVEKSPEFDNGNERNIYLIRGQCNFYLKKYNESIEDFKLCENMIGRKLFLSKLIGIDYYNLGKFNTAKNYFDIAINMIPLIKNPDFQFEKEIPQLYYQRAWCKFEMQDFENVIKDCDKAIEEDSSNTNYYYMKGICYREMGNVEKAIECFNLIIKRDSLNSLAYASIGKCKLKTEDLTNAKKYFDKSIEIFPYSDVYKIKYECEKKLNNNDWVLDSIFYKTMKKKELNNSLIYF